MKGLVADATVYKVSRIPLKFFDIVFYRGFLLSDSVVANVTLLISFLSFFLSSSIACYIRFYHLERINLEREGERERERDVGRFIRQLQLNISSIAWKGRLGK